LVSNSVLSGVSVRRHRSGPAIHGSGRSSSRLISACPPCAGRWRAERAGDLVRLYGPVIAFGSHKPWAVHGSVELEYVSLAALRGALAEAA
jgi:hypothetical protein